MPVVALVMILATIVPPWRMLVPLLTRLPVKLSVPLFALIVPKFCTLPAKVPVPVSTPLLLTTKLFCNRAVPPSKLNVAVCAPPLPTTKSVPLL